VNLNLIIALSAENGRSYNRRGLHRFEDYLTKLLDLFSEIATLKDRLKTIEDDKELKKAAENEKEELQEIKPRVANLCTQQAQDSEEVQKLRKEMEQIKC